QEAAVSTEQTTVTIVTYGMGVYWAKTAAAAFEGRVEIVDLRTINPLDEETIMASVKKHGRCMVLTEEPRNNGFAQAIAGRISKICFEFLDAPVELIGSENLPAIPLNSTLEATMLPNAEKVKVAIESLLKY
ncbi:MAG TPA: transketolase C-terminal domain-containing protein, partial [Bacteroidia bacterium]|nr:transketolase C-terminal domain-containing protein [Bacteroidia bacterium]